MESKTDRVTQFFAIVLFLGAAFGMVLAVIISARMVARPVAAVILAIVFLALYGWTAFVGFRLWQGTRYGRKWGLVLYATQIPMLMTPWLMYLWWTGLDIGPSLHLPPGVADMAFTFNIGSNAYVGIGMHSPHPFVGVNLFALLAVILIARANRKWRRGLDSNGDIRAAAGGRT